MPQELTRKTLIGRNSIGESLLNSIKIKSSKNGDGQRAVSRHGLPASQDWRPGRFYLVGFAKKHLPWWLDKSSESLVGKLLSFHFIVDLHQINCQLFQSIEVCVNQLSKGHNDIILEMSKTYRVKRYIFKAIRIIITTINKAFHLILYKNEGLLFTRPIFEQKIRLKLKTTSITWL